MFSIRRMTSEDRSAVVKIASRIWEGTDYLPAVFDEWVADTEGEFAAVLLDGRIVGCGKLTFLTPTDAWLEGLRKDPRLAEKGLAAAVTRYFLGKLSARADLTSVRFSTYVKNAASIATNEGLGFRRRTAFSVKAWEGTREELEVLRTEHRVRGLVETVSDERLVLGFLERSGYFEATGGLVVEGWRVLPFSRELVAARYVRTGCCRGIVSGSGLAGVAIHVLDTRFSPARAKLVCLDAADGETADALFDDLFLAALAVHAASWEIEWMVPRLERCMLWSAAAGLRSWEQEDDFLVYELPLAKGRGS